MKAAIAILAVLIVGSSAQTILETIQTTLQSPTLLLDSLGDTLRDALTNNTVVTRLLNLGQDLEGVRADLLAIRQGLSTSAKAQIDSVIAIIDSLNLNVPDGNALIEPVIDTLLSQIAGLVNPLIETLSSEITAENISLECLIDEVPRITGNASEVVDIVEQLIAADSQTLALLESLVPAVLNATNPVLAQIQSCPSGLLGSTICLPPLVSAFECKKVSNVQILFFFLPGPRINHFCSKSSSTSYRSTSNHHVKCGKPRNFRIYSNLV